MDKRLPLSVFSAILFLTPQMGIAQDTEPIFVDVSNATEFKAAIEDKASHIRIASDFTADDDNVYQLWGDLVIDLNSHQLTLANSISPRNTISLTIDDLSEAKTGSIYCTGKYAITNYAEGYIYINNGTFDGGTTGFATICNLNGECYIRGGRINATRYTNAVQNNAKLYIEGGTIVGADSSAYSPIVTQSEGVTTMTNGAVYSGNKTHILCFETEYYDDPDWGYEGGTLNLPEGVVDGGAIVLDEKWAIPGTKYINYHLPADAQIYGNTHYYTPGSAFELPVPDTYKDQPFIGWSKSSDSQENLITAVSEDMAENLELYPVWKYTSINADVTPDWKPNDITPAAGEVTSLKSFTLTFDDETGTFDEVAQTGYLKDLNTDTIVANLTFDFDWDEPAKVFVELDNEITEPGSYELYLPVGSFGDVDCYYSDCEYGRCNPDLRYKYIIKKVNNGETDNVETTPANGSTVDALETFILKFVDDECVFKSYSDITINLYDSDNNSVAIATMDDLSYCDAENEISVTLQQRITTPGTYTLNIPAGTFDVGTWDYDRPSTELTFTYTISEIGNTELPINVEIDPADGSIVNELKRFVITFSDEDSIYVAYGDDSAVILDKDGNQIAEADSDHFDYGDEYNQGVIEFDDSITEPGTYTLIVPAGAFNIGIYGEEDSPELRFHYTIETSGIIVFDNDNSDVKYFKLDGSEVKAPQNGEIIIVVSKYKSQKRIFNK